MNKNLQSPTKLTEFAPLQPEEKQQGVGQFISKFFKLSKPTVPSEPTRSESFEDLSQESVPAWAADTSESSHSAKDSVSDDVYPGDATEGRGGPNVLKRIRNLLAVKSNNLQDYADTELKQYWMPDSVSKECYRCSEKFTTFRRRHHCRVCGQIFCSQCCNEHIPGKIFGCTGDLRVCTYCCKVVLSYLQSSEIGPDLANELKLLQENLKHKYGVQPIATSPYPDSLSPSMSATDNLDAGGGTLKRKVSVGYQEENFFSGRSPTASYLSSEEKCRALQNSVSLRNLYEEICRPNTGVPIKTQRYRLRTYNDCFLGSSLVDWLICQQKANTRIQAAAICQALLEGGYIEYVSDPCHFTDGNTLYKLGRVSSPEQVQSFNPPHQEEPSWVEQIPQESSATDSENEQSSVQSNRSHGRIAPSSSYALDLNVEANTVYLSRPPASAYTPSSSESDGGLEKHKATCKEIPVVRTSEQREFVPASGWHDATLLRNENGEKLAYTVLTEAFKQHQQSLLKQLLNMNGLPSCWSDVIIPLVDDIVNSIRPDKNHDAEELDIRQYVQFKKLAGGARENTKIVSGIVCSKNVVHKGMLTRMENPKILLLQCSIVYQRTEGRLMSLDPVLMQEYEYLRHVVARIVALQPNIVMVHRNVSRLAQDLLRENGVTLVQNVKQSILERLSRCTQADIVTNVDAHIGRPRLGTCKRFYLQSFDVEGGMKTLMFFEDLPLGHLGSTVLLRGASKCELIRLKKVASFILFACYNWRLEKSFLMDEFAQPPKDEFFDDSKETSPTSPSDLESLGVPSDETQTKKSSSRIDEREEKRILAEPVENFSDPLHNLTDDNFKLDTTEKMSVAELPMSSQFRKALNGTILSVSPYIVFPVPYLETEVGKKSKLRSFFPEEIYYSSQFKNEKKVKCAILLEPDAGQENKPSKGNMNPLHPFITAKIRSSTDTDEIQTLLAHFRACGGRFPKKPMIVTCAKDEDDKVAEIVQTEERRDIFDPNHHQRLAVLFCSFSHESSNAPAFCVNPWVVHMDFYGCNDIPLGCFLERYCFRLSYVCPSKTCDTAMLNHTRRFVHNSGCVSISLKCLDDEFKEENIMMWSWCRKCPSVSAIVPMSADTWSYSFAKYLELMFHGHVYSRRGEIACPHSLHQDLYQYFGYKNYVATFTYTPVQMWEISLPPPVVQINYTLKNLYEEMINEIKTMALKGHDLYSHIFEKLHFIPSEIEGVTLLKQLLSKEQAQFKQKIEDVQINLTSPTLEHKEFDELAQRIALWKIEDAVIKIKKMIVEMVEQWNLKLADVIRKTDKKKDKVSQQDTESPRTADSKSVASENSDSEQAETGSSTAVTKKIKSLDHGDVVVDDRYGHRIVPGIEKSSLLTLSFNDLTLLDQPGTQSDASAPPSPKGHHRSQSDGTVMSTNEEYAENKKETDKKTVKNILSQLLPSSSTFSQLPLPFSSQEHYILGGTLAAIVVYETEPSSIIAYALNSYDYKRSLDELIAKKTQSTEPSPSPVYKRKGTSDRLENSDLNSSLEKSTGLLSFLRNKDAKGDGVAPNQNPMAIATPQSTNEQHLNAEKTEDPKKSKSAHIEVQFQDSNCNFFCRIFHAEKFSWFRSKVLPVGEEGYIRALARSIQWNARGGKSGSNFAKTADDRFVLKEMSKSEVQLFIDWAPNYFSYVEKCIATSQPTLLGKIMGIYQIIFKNNSTNITLRTNLLVMENLFYNRTVTQKFDLKGSVRNRLVNPNNQTGEIVLLDENLLKMTCDSPLYILPHSKSVLMAAILNDTEFLSAQSVMDYSLLVGLDTENKELVLGIIDYIRTFTWDKKLETMVKKSGILGGQGKLPTIVSPEEYQKRFIEAMHRYFLEVPDHWADLGKGVEC